MYYFFYYQEIMALMCYPLIHCSSWGIFDLDDFQTGPAPGQWSTNIVLIK